jgi:hypothetical protein
MPHLFEHLFEDKERLRDEFRAAKPFELVVIDGFMPEQLAEEVLAEFPGIGEMPKSRDYVFGQKRELSSVAHQGPASARFYEAVTSPEFAEFVSFLVGRPLFIDPAFHGGGFHQGGDGSFLDPHVDFNVHPLHEDWLRTLNVLVYMSKDWLPEYGGELKLRNAKTSEATEIRPAFNRGVIMVTDDRTVHGYDRMTLPEGVTRKSIATYAYEKIEPGSVRGRTTGWVPEGAGVLKRVAAQNYDMAVKVKNKLLGSSTSKNR